MLLILTPVILINIYQNLQQTHFASFSIYHVLCQILYELRAWYLNYIIHFKHKRSPNTSDFLMIETEKVGFEPTVPFGITGFQDQLLKPLGHLSNCLIVVGASPTQVIYYHYCSDLSTTFLIFFLFFYFNII